MIKIAVCEDEQADFARLNGILERYEREHPAVFEIVRFADGMDFAETYKPRWDIIFFDIDMPLLDGMSAAKRIRALDHEVPIIFVTNLKQYAIEGYSVSAVSYILKPATYPQVETLLNKLLRRLSQGQADFVCLTTKTESFRFPARSIAYVEVAGNHKLGYHIADGGQVIEVAGSLVKAQDELPKGRFSAVNSGVLVNLDYVRAIKRDTVLVEDREFTLSRTRKKEFLAAFVTWKN